MGGCPTRGPIIRQTVAGSTHAPFLMRPRESYGNVVCAPAVSNWLMRKANKTNRLPIHLPCLPISRHSLNAFTLPYLTLPYLYHEACRRLQSGANYNQIPLSTSPVVDAFLRGKYM